MALLQDYYKNLHKDTERDRTRVHELTNEINSIQHELQTAVEAKEKILGIVKTLVTKVKANSVVYNLIKKWDVWQEIERLVGGD